MAKRTASTKSAPASKTKRTPATKSNSTAKRKAGAAEITLDRRSGDRRTATATATPPLERREKVNRRRQIDPTTCERDYTDDEVEFMNALDVYKRKNGRMFPTCSEMLEVIRGLGYVKSPASTAKAFVERPADSVPTQEFGFASRTPRELADLEAI